MRINVCTGYPLDSPKGNTVTAERLRGLLRELGHDVNLLHTDTPPRADAQFALHAFKTAAATVHYAQQNEHGKIFVHLTGTDVHGGIDEHHELAERVFGVADRLVIAQSDSLPLVPDQWRPKAMVIHPSVELPPIPSVDVPAMPLFTNVGHLRPVKNPHLMFRALRTLSEPCIACSLGVALERTDGQQATLNAMHDSRYRWLSDCDRATALSWMRLSIATINSSWSEGGANTVLEAIQLGVPVLASDIAGNRGFLGDDYGGYFETDDHRRLARLMSRCLNEPDFRELLTQQIVARQPLFSRQNELEQLANLLADSC